jgi:hypothetical protein
MMDSYHRGALNEAAMALSMPVMAVESLCNSVYRCAKDARPGEGTRHDVRQAIDRLEKAIATLRQVDAMSHPAPVLMQAAE